ncbi:MAG: iron ABC transporter permease [Gammaproteobacteria bacterium]|nr:iron ABC transporter permease [Gammaproteobacteria bacterium]
MANSKPTTQFIQNMKGNASRFYIFIIASILFLLFSIFTATSIGSVNIPMSEIFNSLFICSEQTVNSQCQINPIHHQIIWEIRLPRVLMALLTGAGLSITGAILQSVTRNPLADPYLFGISSGAALGAVIVMAAISTTTLSGTPISITVGALIGSTFSVLLMLTLAGRSAVHVERLLLSGIAVSFMLSAFTSMILYSSEPDTASTLLFWMMGSFSNSQWSELWMPASTLVFGVSLFIIYRRWLGAIQAGDEGALTLGIPVNQMRLFMLIICAAITAVLVAHVGGIGFVGLMIPHISRFIVGTQIHRLLFMTLILGGSFMIWVDVIARSLLDNQVLPVGIVTSAVGSLFFFVILKHRRPEA